MKNIMLLLLSMGLFAQEGIMEVQRIKEENGLESAVLILGEAHGEKIRLIWDFQKIGPGPFTNGVMDTQIVSGMPAVSLRVHNDFGGARFQRPGEWLVRFTLGNLREDFTQYASKETFAIPSRGYSMITLRKGPAGPELRHKEFQEDCELLGKILSWEYNLDESTLALKGYLEGSWDAGEIRIEFDLIVGGDSDRLSSTNRRSMAFSYGNNN
jgi:hypothetical protein